MTTKASILIVSYLVLFFVSLVAIAYLRTRFRKRRPPLEFEYSRGPGESLRKQIEKENEKLESCIVLALLTPIGSSLIAIAAFYIFYPTAPNTIWIPVCLLAGVGGMAFACWALVQQLQAISNKELGLKGERIVAHFLSPLERSGFRVFHDIPASRNGKSFNLDHVVLGPSGIALVETKTRSKGKAKRGRKDHVVTFDGRKLDWPWGSSTSELIQLKLQREWLESWIEERTGKTISATPILAIPGWWVDCSNPKARTRVVNHKNLPTTIKSIQTQALDEETIDLFTRQLESICRIKA